LGSLFCLLYNEDRTLKVEDDDGDVVGREDNSMYNVFLDDDDVWESRDLGKSSTMGIPFPILKPKKKRTIKHPRMNQGKSVCWWTKFLASPVVHSSASAGVRSTAAAGIPTS
jgi:hypothetical protein